MANGAGPLRVDVAQRRLSFGTTIAGARLGLEVDGRMLWGEEARAEEWAAGTAQRVLLRWDDPAIEWALEFRQDGPAAAIIAGMIRNAGVRKLRLGRCRLLDTAGEGAELRLGPRPEEAVALLLSGWQIPNRVVRLASLTEPRRSRTLIQFYEPASGRAFQAGFASFDRITTLHEAAWDSVRGLPTLSVYCDFEGFELAPGAAVRLEKLRLAEGADPYGQLEAWAEMVQREYGIRIWPKIPAGWLGWGWVDGFNVERYEDVVLRNARAIRTRLPGLDIEYIWVSIGNLEGRLPGNWLRWNQELFPSGAQRLVRDLAALGYKLGLWTAPFWLSAKLEGELERLAPALLRKEGKPYTLRHSLLGEMRVLDPTHPLTHEYLHGIFRTYREWGLRYFMLDFLDAVSGTTPGNHLPDGYHDRSLIPGPQAFRTGVRVIAESAGPETYLLAGTGPTLLNAGLLPAARVGTDYGEGRPLEGPGKGFYPGTFVINRPEHWTSHRAATDALAGNYFTHRRLYLADSGNVMTVDKPVPLADAQITATIFGINGGPVMLGDDIARMSEERLEFVKRVFPRLPECARPLDLFEKPEPQWPEKFHLKVRRDWDDWDLVAVFNYRSQPLRERIEFGRLGLDVEAPFVVWDFWNERYLGVHRGALPVDVPAQSVRLLRIARERPHPWVIGTDMHVRQGQAELVDVRWEQETERLSIVATRPRGYGGVVFVRAPAGFAVTRPHGLYLAREGSEGGLIIRCSFDFAEGERQRRVIEFSRYRVGWDRGRTTDLAALLGTTPDAPKRRSRLAERFEGRLRHP